MMTFKKKCYTFPKALFDKKRRNEVGLFHAWQRLTSPGFRPRFCLSKYLFCTDNVSRTRAKYFLVVHALLRQRLNVRNDGAS